MFSLNKSDPEIIYCCHIMTMINYIHTQFLDPVTSLHGSVKVP